MLEYNIEFSHFSNQLFAVLIQYVLKHCLYLAEKKKDFQCSDFLVPILYNMVTV